MMATAGGGREACGMCGNRCQGPLCARCKGQLDDDRAQLLRELRREQEGRRYAPR